MMIDNDKNDGVHLYGVTDDANRQPPAPGGLRGEGADPDPVAVRHVLAAGGQAVEVAETNGVTAVEAAGGPGRANHD